jgi:hypothetical protein
LFEILAARGKKGNNLKLYWKSRSVSKVWPLF